MTLKELLKKEFNADLHISGGYGKSIEEAIVIHKEEVEDYVGLEYFILECLEERSGLQWRRLGQSLLDEEGRKIDKISIETRQLPEGEWQTKEEHYYFDITACYGQVF